MRIEDLRVLKSVSETLNFTLSAKMLYKSESAVSKAIHRLEEELGIEIIYLKHNRICMTEKGTRAAQIAEEILLKAESIYSLGDSNQYCTIYSVDVELLHIVELALLNNEKTKKYYYDEHYVSPQLAKTIQENNKCDIMITSMNIESKNASYVIRFRDEPVLIIAKSHSVGSEPRNLKDIDIKRINVFGKRGSTIDVLEKYIEDNQISIAIEYNIDSALYFKKLIEYGEPGLISKSMAKTTDTEQFDIVDLNDNGLKTEVYITIQSNEKIKANLIKDAILESLPSAEII